MITKRGLVALMVGACGSVNSSPEDAGIDGSEPDASPDSAPVMIRACRDLTSGMPSGPYTIRPDGATAINVTCDMTTDGGGWTVIFIAASDNYDTLSLRYSVEDGPLDSLFSYLESFGTVSTLVAHRDSQQPSLPVVTAEGTAVFPTPAEWKQTPPFQADDGQLSVMASINGAQAIPMLLWFGTRNFGVAGTNCGNQTWDNVGTKEGRICLDSAAAPAYSDFATDRFDACGHTATFLPGTTTCDASKRYSIAVR